MATRFEDCDCNGDIKNGKEIIKNGITSFEHPINILLNISKRDNLDILSKEFAQRMDGISTSLRSEFHYPTMSDLPESEYKPHFYAGPCLVCL